MMNEIHAVVRRLGDGCVWVETDPASACSRCQGGKACSGVSIARLFCAPSREFRVQCGTELEVGDIVRLGMHENEVLRAALLAYGLPVIGLIAGALLGSLMSGGQKELYSIAGAVTGFFAGMAVVRHAGLKTPAPQLLGRVSARIIPLVPQ